MYGVSQPTAGDTEPDFRKGLNYRDEHFTCAWSLDN